MSFIPLLWSDIEIKGELSKTAINSHLKALGAKGFVENSRDRYTINEMGRLELQRLLEEYPIQEYPKLVAQKWNASKSTVHTVVPAFLDSIKEKTNDRELLQILGNLIAIAIMVRRGNLSLDDARIGSEVSSLANSLGTDVSDLLLIVAALYSECRNRNIKAEDLLQSSAIILKIEREQGISYADAPARLGEYQEKIFFIFGLRKRNRDSPQPDSRAAPKV